MTSEEALGIVRLMIVRGVPREVAIENPAIPEEFRQQIRETLAQEENITLEPARILVAEPRRDEWLRHIDRWDWYYWPSLREFLLGVKGLSAAAVRSLDEVTDRILGQLAPPSIEPVDIRGLVLGFVQSGKTANFTALIAKAADIGYRLVIVLSGVDNSLRRQTQIRLNRELVGYADGRANAVRLPPTGLQWHQFTTEDINGDFRPGFANYAALQGSQPVLLVVKKNGPVLRRLHIWLDSAPESVRRSLPMLVIDDEADQASVDTRGSYQNDEDSLPDDYEEPAVINGLIRDLLRKFQRCTYVAYTATPFANILIPHDTIHPRVGNDLYPKDFIVDLPMPDGYFGAEALFGRLDPVSGDEIGGLDIVREVPDEDIQAIIEGRLPMTIEIALTDFVLAGAARSQRSQGHLPATMLIHTTSRIIEQNRLATQIEALFAEMRDEWRYHPQHRILERLRDRWESEFRPLTRASHINRDVSFDQIKELIGPFFEAVQAKVVNSDKGDVLDYEREPRLKAIAVGGNRLSRGLTLEGLLVSYFVRRSAMYDTLMQMGRWFGFRGGYEDLTRIWTTPELSGWFSDLALVEHQLREDMRIYEAQSLTPMQLGPRILQHPAMLVTSRLKQRFASSITIEQSYSGQVLQTVKFPFRRPDDLSVLLEENLIATRDFLGSIGVPSRWDKEGPVWTIINPEAILEFLARYQVDAEVRSISLPLVCNYIERQVDLGELTRWTIAVKGRESLDPSLDDVDWGVPGRRIYQIRRTRLSSDPNSIGVITSPGDEETDLNEEQRERAHARQIEEKLGVNPAARQERPVEQGLLMLYPISRNSGRGLGGGSRIPLYENPADPRARDVIGLAISFPHSKRAQTVMGQYVVGTVGWRPVE